MVTGSDPVVFAQAYAFGPVCFKPQKVHLSTWKGLFYDVYYVFSDC